MVKSELIWNEILDASAFVSCPSHHPRNLAVPRGQVAQGTQRQKDSAHVTTAK
jgi:hypothetical protein